MLQFTLRGVTHIRTGVIVRMRRASVLFLCACWIVAVASLGLRGAGHPSAAPVQAPQVPPATAEAPGQGQAGPSEQALVKQYCAGCHNARALAGGLSLDEVDPATAGTHPDVWEKVIMKLRGGMMPPVGMPRPDEATLQGFAAALEQRPDRATG